MQNTANEPTILFSQRSVDLPIEVPLGLEGMPTEIEVKVGNDTKKFPVAYFEKDVIETGDYEHPVTKQTFSVDERRIDNWVTKFNQMKAAGAEVHCPVDHSDKAEDNKGFVVKMRRDGNKLKSTLQVIGDDGALLALRNRCSMQFWPMYTDEKGRKWQDAIEHVAFTPIPVISGQGPFVPIAASRGQQSEHVYYLSASKKEGSDMELTKLRETLGAAKEITDEKVIELAITKIGEGTKAATDLTAAQTALSKAEADKITLSRQLNPTPPDPEVMADRADNYSDKLELSVEKGEIPLSLAKKIKVMFLPEAGKPNPFMLSRSADFGGRPIDRILELFKDEKFGTPTGTQTSIQLNREVPGDDKPKPVTAERRAELHEMAGLPAPR